MAARRVEIGPFGETVRRNVVRFRGLRGLTLGELSSRLSELGRPMSVPTLSGLENGARRVDADDLVVMALALDISPAALLMPPVGSVDDELLPADAAGGRTSPWEWWMWLTAERSLNDNGYRSDYDRHDAEAWRRLQVPEFAWNRGP